MKYTVVMQERKEVDIDVFEVVMKAFFEFKRARGSFIKDGYWHDYYDGGGHEGIMQLGQATDEDISVMDAFKVLTEFYRKNG